MKPDVYLINQTLRSRIWLRGGEARAYCSVYVPLKFSLERLRAYGRYFGAN
jgi:hypothetical protein